MRKLENLKIFQLVVTVLMTIHLVLLIFFSIVSKPSLGQNAPDLLVFVIPLYSVCIALTVAPIIFKRNTGELFSVSDRRILMIMLKTIKYIFVVFSLLIIWVLCILGFMESAQGFQIFFIWAYGFVVLVMNIVLFPIEIITSIKRDKNI